MAYIGKQPGTGVRNRFLYTATAGQTTFTTSDSNLALSYSDALYMDVYLNGVLLDPANDYTATSGTSIVLGSGASAGDILEVIVYDVFSVFNNTIDGNFEVGGNTTLDNNLTVGGDLTIDDKIIHAGDTNTAIRFPAADTVTIETAGSERVRVNSSGKVGIGDTAPTSKLDLGSDVGSSVTDVTNHIGLFGSQYGFGITSNQLNYVSGADHVFYNTSGNERVRILGTGGLTFNGDTAGANALDDYEEGTWTPVYQALTSNPTVTHSVQLGRYVKSGSFVNVMFRIQTSAASGGSGGLVISGLPFAVTVVSSLFASGPVGFSSAFTNFAPQTLLVSPNSTLIQLIRNSGTNGYDQLGTAITTGELSNASGANDLIGALSYRTDS